MIIQPAFFLAFGDRSFGGNFYTEFFHSFNPLETYNLGILKILALYSYWE